MRGIGTEKGEKRPRSMRALPVVGALVAVMAGLAGLAGVASLQSDGSPAEVELYASGQPLDDVEAVESPAAEDIVDGLYMRAEREGDLDALVGNFAGVWNGAPGFQYVITQFGDAAVIEEHTSMGLTAYGEGTIFDDTATFFFTASDGSQGSADLVLVGEDRIEGSFTNFAWGVSPAAMTRS